MAVIDIRDNPAIDLHVAQSIGSIFSAIGRAETLRKKRYDIDTMMNQIQAGESVQDAAQITRESDVAPYDKGLKGIWQRVGNFASMGYRPDVTQDLTDAILANQLKREAALQDPMQQAQLEGIKTDTAARKQSTQQAAELFPAAKTSAEAGAKVAEAKAVAAPTEIEQSLEAGDQANKIRELELQKMRQEMSVLPEAIQLDLESKRLGVKSEKLNQGWKAEDAERASEIHTWQRMLEARKAAKQIADDEFEAEMRLLEIKGKKLDNKYKKAQTDYTSRRGTSLTPNQRAAILKPAQEDLSMTTDPEAAKKWEGILKSAGFGVRQDASGRFEIYDTEADGGVGNPENTGVSVEQSDYSNVSTEDLLKSLMNDPNIR